MVRVLGPLFSRDAAGQLANRLIFRKAGRAHTCYPYFKPAQPQTPHQVARRTIFAFLAAQWPKFFATDTDTWTEAVPQFGPTPRSAFLAYNLLRWSRFAPPTRRYPAAEAITPPNVTLTGGTGGPAYIDWHCTPFFGIGTWGCALFRQPNTPIAPATNSLGRMFELPGLFPFDYRDEPLTPGTYYAKLSTFSVDGLWKHYPTERSATAT